MALFENLAGISLQHVPYKGGAPAMQAVVAGETQMMIATMPGALPLLKSGRLRALGITSLKRSAVLPEVPAIAESGVPGYEYVTWYGVFTPSGTPRPVIAQLNKAITQSLTESEVQELMKQQGIDPVGSTPEQFATLVRNEIVKWTKVIKSAGIKAE
jgi:tripartite-type tricarboxylate transporter receptor subunit TctC